MRKYVWILPLGLVAITACDSRDTAAPAAAPQAATFKPVLDVKQLLGWVIDPQSGAVWASVSSTVTEKGTEDLRPTTDEQWSAVRNSAAIVAEAGNLLMLEGRSRGADWDAKARQMIETAAAVIAATEV